jgi:hypothetical protein
VAYPIRYGDRVTVLRPLEWAGYTGMVQVPLWTEEDGSRVIGVIIDHTAKMEWVTEVEVVTVRRFRVTD